MKYSAVCLAILPLLVLFQGCADKDAHIEKRATSTERSRTAPDKDARKERSTRKGAMKTTPQGVTLASEGTESDDPPAVEALKKLGANLKTDKDGCVVEATSPRGRGR